MLRYEPVHESGPVSDATARMLREVFKASEDKQLDGTVLLKKVHTFLLLGAQAAAQSLGHPDEAKEIGDLLTVLQDRGKLLITSVPSKRSPKMEYLFDVRSPSCGPTTLPECGESGHGANPSEAR